MKKYRKGLDILLNGNNNFTPTSPFGLMNELVERATPKKPYKLDKDSDILRCPNCGSIVFEDISKARFHEPCGQALDWNDNNE